MMISIVNPVEQSYIFFAIFTLALLLSVRRKPKGDKFSVSLTRSLKGIAILAIFFSHIGYFLVTDNRFLFPLTIIAGVGVDLFLFLSGYGLTASSLRKGSSLGKFYVRRLSKLYIPFWIMLAVIFAADIFILKLPYSWEYVGKAFIGFFSRADLYRDVNSPLWYFTLIVFYYLIFPLVFSKKYPWLSAAIIYLAGYFVVRENFTVLSEVMRLYEVHYMAFPLGVFCGWLFFKNRGLAKICQLPALKGFFAFAVRLRPAGLLKFLKAAARYLLIAIFLGVIAYTSYYSGVGKAPLVEQVISLITMSSIVILFLLINIEFKLFYLFGFYSYEIYLLHWPILYRYDIFFKLLPGWLAVAAYLFLFLGLGWALSVLSKKVLDKIYRRLKIC
jgi:peptidoglycan/LPS O-acetylase OafA/YrhL